MEFGYLPAPPALAGIVKIAWFARGSKAEFDHAEPIVPDGCVELVFNLAQPFDQVDESGRRIRQPRDLLVGPTIRPTTAMPTGEVDLLGLRFWPGRTSAFLRIPMWDLTDQIVAMSGVLPETVRLLGALSELPTNRRLSHLDEALASRASGSKRESTSAVRQALETIESRRGNVSIRALSSLTGVSQRHLERKFREEIGLGAKHVARIARVQHVLRLLQTHASMTGADVAAKCGYTDQAHLIRDCRELTGTTPTRLTTSEPTLATLMREPAAVI